MKMGQRAVLWIVLLAGLWMAGCAQQVGDIDRTQPDKINKQQLEGQWYVRHTLVEVPPSAAFSVAGSQSLTELIEWEVQQDYLIGRRAYEYRDNSEQGRQTHVYQDRGDGLPSQPFEGSVVVAYRILSHFDVQRQYNAATGEQSNVIVENSSDRPWNERDYMRVDWSQNVARDYFFLDGDDAVFRPVSYFVSETDAQNIDRPLFQPDYMELTGRASVQPDMTEFWFGSYPDCFFDQWTDCRENVIKYKTSLMKRTADRDMYSKPQWDQRDRARFQIIDWWRSAHSDHYGRNNATLEWLPLLYNLYDDARLPMEQRQLRPIAFYLNVNWPRDDEGLMWATRKSFEDWNEIFKEVVRNAGYTGPDVDMVVLCENNPVLPSDPEVCRTRVVHVEGEDGSLERVEQDLFEITHGGWIGWGDLRFNQLNIIMEPQNYGNVLAFAQQGWDQRSGEVMSASTHVLWTTMEGYTQRTADLVQLMSGDLPMEDYLSGAYVRRRIAQELDQAQQDPARRVSPLLLDQALPEQAQPQEALPAQLRLEFTQALRKDLEALPDAHEMERMRDRVTRKIERQRELGGQAVWAERMERMRPALGELEARMRSELRQEMQAWPEERQMPQEALEALIPTRRQLHERREAAAHKQRWFAEHHMLTTDNLENIGKVSYYLPLVKRFQGRPRAELEAYLRPVLYYYTIAHEIGHNLGLEHNFAGSNDALNFPFEYWAERAQAGFVPDYLMEDGALKDELAANQLLRSSQYTSIMEYMPYDFLRDDAGRMRNGLGRADRAAVHYAYAGLVEVFDEDQVPDTWSWIDEQGQRHEFDVDRSVIAFDPEVASKNEEFHYSHLPNLALKPQHHVRVCMSPLGHLCDEALPGVDFDAPDADGIYVGERKLDGGSAEDLKRTLFSAAVALSQGRRWATPQQVQEQALIEVPYRTCENSLAGRTYHCQMHDYGVDLWERTQNVISGADFYYLTSHFSQDRHGLYTPTYYAWIAAERELGPLMDYQKHFINRGLIEDKRHFDNWFADPAGGLDAFLASLDVLGHWQGFMAQPSMNDRSHRLRFLRDPATGELSQTPMPRSQVPGASTPMVEFAQYALNRDTMVFEPVDRFNEDSLDSSVTLTFGPGQARYLRSEYDPELGYDYYQRPVIYGNWIAKLIAVELAADPETRFVGTDSGADTAYALNLATLYGRETWKTLAGFMAQDPSLYSHGVRLDGDKAELLPLRDPLQQVASVFPEPPREAWVQPEESFTAQLYGAVYGTILFDLGADNPYAEAANVQILGEDRDIPEGAQQGLDYVLVPDMRTQQTFVIFQHQREEGLFFRERLASPTWLLAQRILDRYAAYGFDDPASWEESMQAARREAGPARADAVEDEYRRARDEVERDLRTLDVLRAMLVRYGARHVNP